MEPKSYIVELAMLCASRCADEGRNGGRERTYRGPYDTRVSLDPVLVTLTNEAEGADEPGGDQLNREDGVDLADELVSDIDRGLGDGASKLFPQSISIPHTHLSITEHTLKSSGRLSSLLRGAPKRPWVSSREEEPSA